MRGEKPNHPTTDLPEIQFQTIWCFLKWKFHFQVYLWLGFASQQAKIPTCHQTDVVKLHYREYLLDSRVYSLSFPVLNHSKMHFKTPLNAL